MKATGLRLDHPWVLAGICVLMAVPLAWPQVLPLIDLPSHMASYHVAQRLASSPDLQRYYDFSWVLVGNMGVDLAVYALRHLMGVEAATKLAVALIPVLTAAGFLAVSRQIHGRVPAVTLAALPLAYNYSFMFGFVNFCLAAAVALLCFGLWLKLGDARRWAVRAGLFAILSFAVWLCHALGWVMLGTLCAASSVQRRHAAGAPIVRATAMAVVDCLPLLSPIVAIAMQPRGGEPMSAGAWFDLVADAKWAAMVLRDRWLAFDLFSTLLLVALVPIAIVSRAFRIAPAGGWPALALLAMMLIVPGEINGASNLGPRLAPYVLGLAIVSIGVRGGVTGAPARWRRIVAAGAVAFLLVRLAANGASFLMYDAAYQRNLQALERVPRGSAVASLAVAKCNRGFANWYRDRYDHLAGMAVVRRDAFTNVLFFIEGLHQLQNHYPQSAPFTADLSQFVLTERCPTTGFPLLAEALRAVPRTGFGYIWVLGENPGAVDMPADATVIWSSPDAMLLRLRGR